MKITLNILKKIIKEEIENSIKIELFEDSWTAPIGEPVVGRGIKPGEMFLKQKKQEEEEKKRKSAISFAKYYEMTYPSSTMEERIEYAKKMSAIKNNDITQDLADKMNLEIKNDILSGTYLAPGYPIKWVLKIVSSGENVIDIYDIKSGYYGRYSITNDEGSAIKFYDFPQNTYLNLDVPVPVFGYKKIPKIYLDENKLVERIQNNFKKPNFKIEISEKELNLPPLLPFTVSTALRTLVFNLDKNGIKKLYIEPTRA